MFTKSQIEEIAAKLADLYAIKDSQFNTINKPLNGSENIPILQDAENRLLSLPDLVNLITGGEDREFIKCSLEVQCLTANATIQIKGEKDTDYVDKTNYIAHYGEVVDVKISAEGYDTWFGAVSMTQSHILIIALNKEGSGDTPTSTNYSVMVKLTGTAVGANITINNTDVANGAITYFPAGTKVDIYITKSGFETEYISIDSLSRNEEFTVDHLDQISDTESPYIRFEKESIEIDNSTGRAQVQLLSNVSWIVKSVEAPTEDDESTINSDDIPSEIILTKGESYELPE